MANYFTRDSHTASATFNQKAEELFINQPRFPFEYYISFNLDTSGTSGDYIKNFFNSGADIISPLCKSVEMPSMKIETTPLNQYNRKRLSQSKIAFEPIKMVFHDVCDGKTLQFWDMYYRYYFADGNEPGQNQAKTVAPSGLSNPNLATPQLSATNTNGNKSTVQNIISDKLDNHNFGFNLPTVQNTRNLIQSIEIYQVHSGLFNQVTLVNPRISAFTHDSLNYATSDKTLEITFTIDYEYAYYTIQNMELGTGSSSLDFFSKGDFLDPANVAFTQNQAVRHTLYQRNNPSITGIESSLFNSVNNVQSSLFNSVNNVQSSILKSASISSSSISGLVNISPQPVVYTAPVFTQTRPFGFSAAPDSTPSSISAMYQDVDRTGD